MKPDDVTEGAAEAEAKAKAEAEAAAAEAEAKAKAEAEAGAAEAEAKAKAEAEAAAGAEKPKRGRKAKAPVASAADLRAAIARIEGDNHPHGREALVAAMTEAGAQIGEKDGATQISYLGLTIQTTAGLAIALNTWCSKARRAVLNGEAV